MISNGSAAAAVETRSACPITRTHQRFLLRSLEFTQQYAPMYRCRMGAQYTSALHAIQRIVREDPMYGPEAGAMKPRRVLELQPGMPAVCVGIVYKNMKLLPRFLDEYQSELVRIDAGDDNDEESGVVEAAPPERSEDAAAAAMRLGNEAEEDASNDGQTLAAADEHYSVCNSADELMLEDSSGRVLLQGLDAERFCTGVVLGVYGTLLPNGSIKVLRYAFSGDLRFTFVPRPLIRAASPCYIAFVSGLSINIPRGSSKEEQAAATRARASLELLVEFLCGNTGNASLRAKAKCVSRLVIGGDSIAPTDELKLKKKVKLDPSDHVRLNDDKAQASTVTSAALMRQLDTLLERVVRTVEVELMPGANDMSDAFQPQQPLHPLLLPKAGKHSTLRLVSNPFCFTAQPPAAATAELEVRSEERVGSEAKKHKVEVADGVNFFVTSGQNINDVARESRFPTRLDAMCMVVVSGCACPTAPNTLFSYPFCNHDPFLFQHTPHCVVACDQPQFETRYATLEELHEETHRSFTGPASLSVQSKEKLSAASTKDEENKAVPAEAGVRLICVPSFARSGALVLVDVNSPTLETSVVTFSVP
ncbi:DNA polymerase delta subunit 2 [Leishmania donovani]|uniref:DNA_polymerase_delta_subunit_2_putative/GeneDB:Lm jF.25.1410 n=1 Tax=Leishmania donovani TaxID=5661 RepID=A0A6J8FDC2_LEIDO|nr:DNA polymerase delta subunit 2 [Leishmania donovani]VDZ45336.1 DNA_polymerase_delta_subunit_2_putative/GeneDB:LmjF.25.1410 [Leishmania donovani]